MLQSGPVICQVLYKTNNFFNFIWLYNVLTVHTYFNNLFNIDYFLINSKNYKLIPNGSNLEG